VIPIEVGTTRRVECSIEVRIDEDTAFLLGYSIEEITETVDHELLHARQLGELGVNPRTVTRQARDFHEEEARAYDEQITNEIHMRAIKLPPITLPMPLPREFKLGFIRWPNNPVARMPKYRHCSHSWLCTFGPPLTRSVRLIS
jgi:hypothetical protein